MQISKKLNFLGQVLLLLATLLWGTSFFILKETIANVPTFYVIAIRFLFASLLLFIIFFKRIIKMTKKTFIHGAILGLILSCAYCVQTLGLSYTTSSRNAFLTATYCVMTPFLVWLFYKNSPKIYNVLSACICFVGIGLVAFSASDLGSAKNVLFGDLLTIIGALFYAFQIIFIDKFQSDNDDSFQLLTTELFTVALFHIILSLIFELPKGISTYSLNLEQILKIGYLTIMCTLVAQLCQILGQKYTTSNQASLILSLEAVFGTLFSVILGQEILTISMVIGFVIIFVAMMINEFKFDPIKLLNKKS